MADPGQAVRNRKGACNWRVRGPSRHVFGAVLGPGDEVPGDDQSRFGAQLAKRSIFGRQFDIVPETLTDVRDRAAAPRRIEAVLTQHAFDHLVGRNRERIADPGSEERLEQARRKADDVMHSPADSCRNGRSLAVCG